MGTIRYVKEDYLKGSIFDSLNKKVKIKLSNKNLTTSELITEPDPEHSYPHVIFLDQVLDSEVNYTLLYNAKVGTIIPIKESDKSNLSNDWIECDGSTLTKDQYPMLYDLIKDYFYNEDLLGNEIPIYENEFVLPKLDKRKINSVDDEYVVWMIKAKGRIKGNYYLKRDNIV